MKTCTKCLNDTTVTKISFDKNGVCNYCNNYETIKDKLNDYDSLEKLFLERINNIKGKYDYDVALGISGGKDSIYVLYNLINKYHLKVKTFTMNNGFLSEEAKQNIDKLVKEFNVDHEYIEFDTYLLQRVYHYSMKHFLVPCIACSFIGYAAMINYTTKINAGMCIHGRSREQMFRRYNNDVFSNFVDLGLKSINEIDIDKEYKKILDDVNSKLNKTISKDIEKILYNGIEDKKLREFASFFLYHEYDEDKIVDFLKKNTSWTPPKDYNHYDCMVHNACKYIYQVAEGRAHRLPETSVLIREGKIDKNKAKELLQKEIIDEPKEELERLCSFANINQKELFMKAKVYKWYKNK